MHDVVGPDIDLHVGEVLVEGPHAPVIGSCTSQAAHNPSSAAKTIPHAVTECTSTGVLPLQMKTWRQARINTKDA